MCYCFRIVSDEYRLKTLVRIMRLYLEDDDQVSAETFLNRATHLLPVAPPIGTQDPLLPIRLSIRLSQARILESKRKFTEAAQRYLSLSNSMAIDVDDRIQCLSQAIICSILAPAGPLRIRLLSNLFIDLRSKELTQHYPLLERVHRGGFLTSAHVETFKTLLQPHHLAILADGKTTVLDRAMIEHNVLAAADIYRVISIQNLAKRVGVAEKGKGGIEEVIRGMVKEGRIKAEIDRVGGWIKLFKITTDQDSEQISRMDNKLNGIDVKQIFELVQAISDKIKAL